MIESVHFFEFELSLTEDFILKLLFFGFLEFFQLCAFIEGILILFFLAQLQLIC